MHNSTVARLDALTRALGASTILALLLAPNASAQQAAELFTAGTVIADEHTRFESLHDINGDGILDAVGWYWMQSTLDTIRASVTLFDGEGGVIDHLTAISPVAGNNVNREGASGSCVGDFDGDGRLEQIVYLYDTFFHMEFDPSGSITFLPNFAHPNPAWHGPSWSYKNLVAADFDGDGVDDFIAVGTHEIELWTVDASGGTLLDAISFGPNHWRTTVDKGDFNGDGQADIAVSFVDGAGNFVRIYPMAAGSFGVPIEVALDDRGGPIDLTTWDADGDGDDDLMLMGTTFPVVWPAAWDDTSRVIEQTAPGVFVPWPRQVDSGPSTSLADVNGDGHLDGICCGGSGTPYTLLNNEPSEFMVCLGDGLGGFDHAVPFQGLGAQHIAGAMDFDGDGDMDLVAGRVVLLNYAGGSLTRVHEFAEFARSSGSHPRAW